MNLDALMSCINCIDKFVNMWADFPSIPTELQWDNAAMKENREKQFLHWLLSPSIARPAIFEDTKIRRIMTSRTDRQVAESAEFMYDFLCLMKPGMIGPRDHRVRRVLQYLNEVNKIFAFDWFSRIWVLQEVGSNADVTICHGGQNFKWEALQAGAFFQASLLYVPSIRWALVVPSLFFVLTVGRKRRRLPSTELLGWTSGFESTDVRDSCSRYMV